MKAPRLIAICACRACIYSIDSFIFHDNFVQLCNARLLEEDHFWVYVADVIIVQDLRRTDEDRNIHRRK